MAVLIEKLSRVSLPAGPWDLPRFGLCIAILLLNLVDALFTLAFLQFNLAEEANPLMNFVYRLSPVGFVLLKLTMVQGGILILHHFRRLPIAHRAMNAMAAVYVAIVSYHVTFATHLALS
jgi:hypothetical protein